MKKILVLFLLIISSILISSHSVFAQTSSKITVFPAIQDIKINPGEKKRIQIQFYNSSDSVVTGSVKVADYSIQDKKGTPVLLDETSMSAKPKYAAASWITIQPTEIAIASNNFVTVTLDINTPQDLSTCGYYALAYFQPNASNFGVSKQTGSSINLKIGGLINLHAQNKSCIELASLNQFSLPSFSEYGPLPVTYDLLNQGNIDVQPEGTLTIYNLFGKVVDKKQIPSKRIFPETIKEYQTTLGEKWMIGQYKVVLTVAYGENGKTVTKTAYIWVFPWKIAIVIFLGIMIATLFGFHIYQKNGQRELQMQRELEKEESEIEKLKEQLRGRNE